MQVSVETFGALGRRLKVAVPADQVEKEFNARLQRLSKQVKMPGFRPGKVPLKIVEAQYGPRLMDEVAGALIQTSMFEAIGSHGLRPVGDPQIQRKPVVRGEQLEYTVEFEIFPEVKHFDLAGTRIERPVVSVTDEDVNRTLDTIRKQRTSWNPIEREARLGDRVTIDFVGRMDGKEFEGGKANGFQVVLGSGSLIEDMEKGLVGAKGGDTRDVPAKFPSGYRHSPLAGKKVDFEVKIIGVEDANLPELNEAFASEMGVKEGGLDKLKADVRSNLEREAVNRARAVVRARALKLLLDANPIEIPQNLVEAEIQRLKNSDASSGMKAGDDKDYQRRSRNRVALGLILGEFIRSRGLVTDPAKVRAKLEEIAADYESPPEFVQWHYQKPERLAEIESLVMEEQVVEELLKSAEIADQPVGFQDLLKIETAAQ
jgi:trigger factor